MMTQLIHASSKQTAAAAAAADGRMIMNESVDQQIQWFVSTTVDWCVSCRMLDDFSHEMDSTHSRLDNVMKKLAKVSHMTSGDSPSFNASSAVETNSS